MHALGTWGLPPANRSSRPLPSYIENECATNKINIFWALIHKSRLGMHSIFRRRVDRTPGTAEHSEKKNHGALKITRAKHQMFDVGARIGFVTAAGTAGIATIREKKMVIKGIWPLASVSMSAMCRFYSMASSNFVLNECFAFVCSRCCMSMVAGRPVSGKCFIRSENPSKSMH